jgi:hypothetical protein
MHSFHHSRGRILFEVACALGISASCVWAWMQTYATAMLPAAAIAALYGLVHAFDMVRHSPAVAESVEAVEPATDQGDLLAKLEFGEAEPVINEEPKFVEPPAEVVAETAIKRKRRSSRPTGSRRDRRETEPEVAQIGPGPEPEIVAAAAEAEPEVAEPKPAIHIVDAAPDEPEYVPATPLFETEPFVRQQRAAFGRKAR